mmetsp:Transcript_48374/g.146090  ORF Transcript_48374/g.146090 Transcript_48374/m.146090 type:complete len:548 (-) Transcript_48374:55-1698(-)
MSTEGTVRPSVHIVLVRHAESRNNEVYRDARALFGGGTPSFDLEGWNNYVDERRSADPGLSAKGRRQANALAEYLVRHLGRQASRPVRVVTSPMRRTLETIRPTLAGLKKQDESETGGGGESEGGASPASVIVNAFYHESEGCHVRDVPHPGMNRAEINAVLCPASLSPASLSFDGFDPNDDDAGWYSYGTGPETRSLSESRAAKFYLWLCEHLDSQLAEASARPDDHGDVFDAGVAHPEEGHEIDCFKFQPRRRRRRTCVLVGHGDFMGLVLKRIVAGFGHAVEMDGVHHRSAFVHYNTGITELEYFGRGRFLVMGCNQTPHLDRLPQDDLAEFKSGGGLKDGWSYLMPDADFLLDAEVDVAFEDELEDHVREQAEAMRELYLGRRKSSIDDDTSEIFDATTNVAKDKPSTRMSRKSSLIAEVEGADSGSSSGGEVTLVVKRGLQLVGCASLHVESGRLSDLVVRPSAKNTKVGQALVEAAKNRAKQLGGERLVVDATTEESREFYENAGFREVAANVTGRGADGGKEGKDDNGTEWEGVHMELVL